MFIKKFDKHKPYFRSVAMATIIAGSAVFALGVVELLLNLYGGADYASPVGKITGGLVVISLGYIHLELEQIRIK